MMHIMIHCGSALHYSPCAYDMFRYYYFFIFLSPPCILTLNTISYVSFHYPNMSAQVLFFSICIINTSSHSSINRQYILPTKPKLSSSYKSTVSSSDQNLVYKAQGHIILIISYSSFPVKFASHYNNCNKVFIPVVVCIHYQKQMFDYIILSSLAMLLVSFAFNSNSSYSYIALSCSLVNPSNLQHAQWQSSLLVCYTFQNQQCASMLPVVFMLPVTICPTLPLCPFLFHPH